MRHYENLSLMIKVGVESVGEVCSSWLLLFADDAAMILKAVKSQASVT